MPASQYVRLLRERIGSSYLLLPGVTAVIRDDDRFLLARQRDSERWSLIGGCIEPGEDPRVALLREVREELGVGSDVIRIIGAYGGAALENVYPNGDQVGYVTVAYLCSLHTSSFLLDEDEVLETRWATLDELTELDHHEWIDQVLIDATR
ncbi:NUDIX domain-containing protein [Curtobacterium flaccumfaciens]|uniref:NUDIX domain-containing protein n=1 Tax=Curtobacterium flaccumfaciens TaxID=2035 RepID=UPI001BDDD4AA|nr:NUDIX domain-containing protein [Curtobacterium flaccumfaciens]MBT1683292.1 NUDIX domain-containing protein [Curtobacterium flaccumfaciens pv. flaccumfaciens]